MLKDLLKEGGLYTLANLLTKGVSLLLIPFYTTYFSPADYGVIDILNLFTMFIMAIFTLQLNQGLARYIAEPSLSKQQRVLYASTGTWFASLVLFITVIILLIFSMATIGVLSTEELIIEYDAYLYATLTIFLNGIFYLNGVTLRFLRRAKQYSILSTTHAIFGIALVLLFVIVFNMGVESIYLSYLFILPPLIAIQFYLLRNDLALVFSRKALKKLLRYSVPLIPASIAYMLMNFTDRFYIKEYLDGFSELGIYAMAAKFSSIIGLIVAGFTSAITPIIYQSHNDKNTPAQLSRIFNLYLAIGTIGVLGLSLFSKEIVTLTTNERFHDAAFVMPVMFLTAFFVGIAMFSQGLNIQKKTVLMAVLVITFAGVNVALNQLLVPNYGQMGAAIATLIATSTYQLLVFWISQKYYAFEYSFVKISLILTLQVLLITGIILWNPIISVEMILLKIGILFLYVFVLRIFKVFSFDRLFDYLKNRKN